MPASSNKAIRSAVSEFLALNIFSFRNEFLCNRLQTKQIHKSMNKRTVISYIRVRKTTSNILTVTVVVNYSLSLSFRNG